MQRLSNYNALYLLAFSCIVIYIIFNYKCSCLNTRFSTLFASGVGNAVIIQGGLSNGNAFTNIQNITECSCIRSYLYPPDQEKPTTYDSSCSDEGSFYKTGQKVVSFSMHFPNQSDFQRKKLYGEGISVNLARLKRLYPGYSMRLYTDEPLAGDFCLYVCSQSDFFWCDVTKSPSLGNQSGIFFMAWRFFPLGDPTVDIFLSRDLDSAITERESAVVSDWINNTDKAFHLMRDKKDVHNLPILGGMWGARNKLLHEDGKDLRAKLIELNGVKKQHKGLDQQTLNKVIFYPRKKDIVAYDSYHCKKWSNYTLMRPYPRKRENAINDFVGNVDLGKQKYKLAVCPKECRPDYGQDWEYC